MILKWVATSDSAVSNWDAAITTNSVSMECGGTTLTAAGTATVGTTVISMAIPTDTDVVTDDENGYD
jgi:hypothetical protein